MQGLREHHLKLLAQRVQDEMFMDEQYLEDDVDTFDDQDREYPGIVMGQIKEIDTEYIRGVHTIKQIRTFFVVSIDLLYHGQKRRRLLPEELKELGEDKQDEE